MSRHKDLPVMLGKNLKKGLLAYRNKQMGGFDLVVLWLKKQYETGAQYKMEDIDKVDAVLHFCDKESVVGAMAVLDWMLEHWEEE